MVSNWNITPTKQSTINKISNQTKPLAYVADTPIAEFRNSSLVNNKSTPI